MKLGNPVLVSLLAVECMTVNALATDSPKDGKGENDKSGFQSPTALVGNPELASKVIGMEIRDSDGRKLAKVKDFSLDLQNGRIAEVVVATGGWLGMDEKDIVLPPGKFTFDGTARMLRLAKMAESE